ncbi:uncharacterized protein BX664DRAFT_344936 [Halteromyces radiatus]|uniref:uncharacterized protein n=1 Tax=Halteromyces radiatus TaxID=101107 RepID=UPI00221F09EC|nr:uncharacterized protein BX664DRAFT_344936 [Halteromyces radiatus]KAI8098798.1 hypothetical protein BX664DRAFT_344936 [Halteromyces radiatus]
MRNKTTYSVRDRNRSACTLVDTKIYCFGGGKNSASEGSYNIYDDHFSLDLTTSLTVNQPITDWVKINPPTDYIVERRWGHDLVTLADNTSGYIMTMGNCNSDGKTILQNVTTIYAPVNQSWTSIPMDSSSMPSSFASSALMDSKGVMWSYGGLIPMDNQTYVLDGFYNDKANFTHVRLPTNIYGLDTKTWQWISLAIPTQYNVTADHGAAITEDNKMYIIGGMTIDSNQVNTNITNSRRYVPMDQILIFDTIDHTWQQVTTKGTIPSQRRAFTLTYLPQKKQLLLYGGVYDTGSRFNGRVTVLDVCYILDITSLTWTPIDVHAEPNKPTSIGSGQLYGHSSVLYNTDLFIMFGVDESNGYRADVNILDTTTWAWKITYNGTTFWTTAMIIGLVVGIVGAFVLVGVVVYLLRFRRTSNLDDGKKFLPSKRPNDQFVIDTADPRLRMEEDPVFIESPTDDPTVILDSHGSPATRSATLTSLSTSMHSSHMDRPLSATILGSIALANGLTTRPMSSMSHGVTESTFTSFSGTTKPDLNDLPSTPTTATQTIQRIKPDGES